MRKTKRIIAAVTAAIITATSASIISVFADNGEVKKADSVSAAKADNTESRLQEYADDISTYMMMNSIAGDAFVHDNKVVVTYSAHEDKIKAYIQEKGIDESIVIYEKGHNVGAIIYDKTDVENPNEESSLKVYAKDISDFMIRNGIAGDAFVHDNKVVVTYSSQEDEIKAYVKEKGIDESVIVYEPGKNVDETYPTNINVEYSEQYHQIRFNWSKVKNVEQYGVAVYLAGKWRIQTQNITDTTYTTPKNLTPGKTYKVAIAAKVDGKWDVNNAIKNAVTVTVK